VDYALFCHGVPVIFIEAKAFGEKLSNHAPQLSRYFNATPEVAVAAITNGQEWRFFTDLNNKNVMDGEPFLRVDFGSLDASLIARLYRFRHDEFQPDALRTLAEESVYLNAFTGVIGRSLREPDAEFVRYVASRSGIQRQLNARFIELIGPIVQQAIGRAVSDMVVSGLTAKPAPPAEAVTPDSAATNHRAD
jgi:predicted type IV restriction endonuclease